ncbi:MAG: hypothetical protein WC413_03450 [Candidatus Nanoarchaeia archaeon]
MIFYNLGAIILIFVTLIIFFIFSFGIDSVKQEILAKEKIDVNSILLNYLRTPVNVEGQEVLVSDLIRMYVKNKEKYRTNLEGINQKIFNKLFDQYNLYIDNQIISQGKVAMSEDFGTPAELGGIIETDKTTSSEFNLPDFDKEIKIKLVIE